MDLTTFFSVVCLSTVGGICTLMIFHPDYEETLLERVGASLIAIWCFARVDYKISTLIPTEPVNLILHVGLAIFFIGLLFARFSSEDFHKKQRFQTWYHR